MSVGRGVIVDSIVGDHLGDHISITYRSLYSVRSRVRSTFFLYSTSTRSCIVDHIHKPFSPSSPKPHANRSFPIQLYIYFFAIPVINSQLPKIYTKYSGCHPVEQSANTGEV